MKRKNILIYLSTFLLLMISAVYLVIAFFYQSIMRYFIICAVTFILFCVTNKLAAKSITRPEGYNFLQGYFFYKKCRKNSVDKKPDKLNSNDMKVLMQIADNYDFLAGFNEKQLRRVFADGYEVANLYKNKAKEK